MSQTHLKLKYYRILLPNRKMLRVVRGKTPSSAELEDYNISHITFKKVTKSYVD